MIKRYNQNQIEELAQILNNDGVISVPTDTVYGLCAKINSKNGYEKLMQIKNRPLNKEFPIMFSDLEQIKEYAIVDQRAEKIIKQFMPGPITIILNKKKSIINNKKDTIAIRMATSDALKELILKIGCPIFMTSANISGKEVCKNLDEIEKFLPNLDGMLEGEVSYGKSSTIIDCTADEIKVLREGPILLVTIQTKLI